MTVNLVFGSLRPKGGQSEENVLGFIVHQGVTKLFSVRAEWSGV
jgi:hypothetical protein